MVHIKEIQKAAMANTKWKKNLKYHFSCTLFSRKKIKMSPALLMFGKF